MDDCVTHHQAQATRSRLPFRIMLIAKWYETAMFRFKTTFGATLSSRELRRQKTEILVKAKTLNTLRKIAAPAYK